MDIISKLYNKAKDKNGTILLPEAILDERVMQACIRLVADKFCNLVLLGKKEQFPIELKNSPLVKIIDTSNYPRYDEMVKLFMQIRKKNNYTYEQACEILSDPRYFGTMLVEMGEADGIVLGAYYTSADALRPALQIIKGKAGKMVVGSMLIERDDFVEPQLYLDVSLNENPNAEQLADIGLVGADFYYNVLNREPKVAFLSYSTFGSADGELVEKVRKATDNAKNSSHYIVEGEMQFDAAVVPSVAKTKCPTSKIMGKANVFVFPDLNCGNIAYKIAQRLGGCKATGPIMLNFRHPVNDLSRGCSVNDIYNTVVITKLQIEEGEN
ncbi:MAG: phosphotransacetylase [Clostridia bacterium]|nr:phosphotransacetylase [Clostridia bacterium]